MRLSRTFLALSVVPIVALGCGSDPQEQATPLQPHEVADDSRQADCPAPTAERIRAVARIGERLRAETLPDGFVLTSGDEADPGGGAELTYADPAEPGGPRVQLSRRISPEPAHRFVSGEGTSSQQIRGHAGVVTSGATGPEFTTAAWNEAPDTVIIVTGYRLGRSETLRVAEGVRYEPGTAGDTVAVMPAEAPAECRTLPPEALSRKNIAGRFPTGGAQTKLVRLAQITQSQNWAEICTSQPCTEGLVAWVALRQGPPGTFPHSCPSGAPPEACSGSWALSIIDAAGHGSGYGTSIGNGAPPPEFAAWDDLAP